MAKSAVIELSKAAPPTGAPVTRFRGEPSWLSEPCWPLSRHSEKPMSFLGQILLADVPGLPEQISAAGWMAYLFMTESEESVDPTWEPEGGENAVVIQPGDGQVLVSTVKAATRRAADVACGISEAEAGQQVLPEVTVHLTPREEPDFIDAETGLLGFTISPETAHIDEATRAMLWADKLGGVPSFWQACEYPPSEGTWLPLLQLNENDELLAVNFGTGRAFAFVSVDGRKGRLLWQC